MESSVGDHAARDGESAISASEPEKSTAKWRVMAPLERWPGTEKLLSVRVSALAEMASTPSAAAICSLVALRRDMVMAFVRRYTFYQYEVIIYHFIETLPLYYK